MKLDPPIRQYLVGKLPSHSGTKHLSENFVNIHERALLYILQKHGYLDENLHPTRQAIDDDVADICEKKILWHLEKISELLIQGGVSAERRYVNQDMPEFKKNPGYAGLGTIGTYFNATARTVGKWLDDLWVRENGEPTKDALSGGLAQQVEMLTAGIQKQTRTITQWSVLGILAQLKEAGHPFDFDYQKNLQGSGKNSAVAVDSIDARARDFAHRFATLFKDPQTRGECEHIVSGTPTIVIRKAEEILKHPGFITKKEYLRVR